MKVSVCQSNLRPLSALSAIEQQQVMELVETLGIKGEIEKVCFGVSYWQTRFVVRAGGELVWWRLSDPALSSNRSLYRELLMVLELLVKHQVAIQFGEIEINGVRHVCFQRPFYRALLVGAPLEGLVGRQSLVRRICSAVLELHSIGVCHGHLSPSNIAFDMGKVFLIDVAMCSFAPSVRMQKQGVAPEVQQGYLASLPADVYGLAGIIRGLLTEAELDSRQRMCLDKMESTDPTRRPTLEWIVDVFSTSVSSNNLRSNVVAATDNISGEIISESKDTHRGREGFQWMNFKKAEYSEDRGGGKERAKAVSNNPYIWGVLSTVIVLLMGGLIYQYSNESGLFRAPENYPRYWRGGSSDDLWKVVWACLRGDQDAQNVVLESIKKDFRVPDVDEVVLEVGFDERWEALLSDEDRRVLFALAFDRFDVGDYLPTKWDARIYPGVIYAWAASGELSSKYSYFLEQAPLSHLGTLPGGLGDGFRILSGIGLKSVSDPVVLGWIKINTGQFSLAAFESFLFGGEEINDVALFTKTDLLIRNFGNRPELMEGLYQLLRSKPSSIEKLLGWFDQGQLGLWSKEQHDLQLKLLVSDLPKTLNEKLKLIDLVLFPRKAIREQASERVAIILAEESEQSALRDFLNGAGQKLSRTQLVSILSLFMERETRDHLVLIRNWFRMKPDPEAVVSLILIRRAVTRAHAIKELDLFDVEAAVYLSSLPSDTIRAVFDSRVVEQLVQHPEPQVRVLGYQHLDLTRQDSVSLLKSILEREPDARLRDMIQKRLEAIAGL